MAVEAQAADVLELLLRTGAHPAARMYGGRTPLGSALLRPNPTLARLLRAHGAPEPEDEDRPSPSSSSSDSDSDSDNADEGVSPEETPGVWRGVGLMGKEGEPPWAGTWTSRGREKPVVTVAAGRCVQATMGLLEEVGTGSQRAHVTEM